MSKYANTITDKSEIRAIVERSMGEDFNFIPLERIEKLYRFENLEMSEDIIPPSFRALVVEDVDDYYIKEAGKVFTEETGSYPYTDRRVPAKDFLEWLEKNHDQRESLFDGWNESCGYPVHGTLYEARDWLGDFLSKDGMVDGLYSLGIGFIKGNDRIPTNPMLYLTSGGIDYLEYYWVPMYRELFPFKLVKRYIG